MSDDTFATHRPLVLRLAYDITGSWTDAEDVAQEAWLRWSRAVASDVTIRDPRAYLARIGTNLALDVVRRREYPGTFLPEPAPDAPADSALERADDISVALELVLLTLSPLERAAFVLHDAFGFSHGEIAEILSRDAAAVRQLVSRARSHVQARRPRYDVDPGDHQVLLDAFLNATFRGDVPALVQLLADDVVLVSDGGGKASVARRPVEGACNVARFLTGIAKKATAAASIEFRTLNGMPAWIARDRGVVDQVAWLSIRAGRIRAIHIVRNPDKLGRL